MGQYLPPFSSIHPDSNGLQHYPDTSYLGIHNYNSHKNSSYFTDLGNQGSIQYNLNGPQFLSGFHSGREAWQSYIPQHIIYQILNPAKPFTDLYYVQGQRRLLNLNFLHAQQIRGKFYVIAGIYRMGSNGAYIRQSTDITRFRFSIGSVPKTVGFNWHIASNWDRANMQVNGGLVQPDSFYKSGNLSRFAWPVSLQSTINYIKNYQYLTFLNYKIKNKMLNYFGTELLIERNSYIDSSGIEDIQQYKFSYFSLSRNYDSTRIYQIKPGLFLAGYIIDTSLKYVIYLKHNKWNITNNRNFLATGNNGSVSARLDYKRGFFYSYLYHCYYLYGYNKDNYQTQIGLRFIKGKYNLDVRLNHLLNRPPLHYQMYISNHRIYNQIFSNQYTQQYQVEFSKTRKSILGLKIDYQQFTGFIYADTTGYFKQTNSHESVASSKLFSSFTISKFRVNFRTTFQFVSNSYMIRIPKNISELDFSFFSRYRKTSLYYSTGFVVNYWSKTMGMSWDPVIYNFRLNDNLSMGGYPMIDWYLNGQINRFSFFVRWDHILYGIRFFNFDGSLNIKILPDNYSALGGLPMQPQAYRFGFSWRFYD